MPNFGRRELTTRDGERYALELGFDDAAIMDDKFVAEVKAIPLNPDGTERDGAISAYVTYVPTENIVTIELPGREMIVLELGDVTDHFDDSDRDLHASEEVDDFLRRMLEAGGALDRLGDIIDFVPPGEPAMGCIIKAGVSTTLGQIVTCYGDNREAGSTRRLIWAILRCLGVNSPLMLAKAGLRTLRCWATMGIA